MKRTPSPIAKTQTGTVPRRLDGRSIDPNIRKYDNDPYRPDKRSHENVAWHMKGPGRMKSIYLMGFPGFSARGMRLIYYRNDHYPFYDAPSLACKMDIWQDKYGRILVRFYTRRPNLDQQYYELRGVKLPKKWSRNEFEDNFVPEALRDCYSEWVDECFKEM